MDTRRADTRALSALALGALLIGFAPIFVRLSDVGPIAAAFWRCALAWPVIAIAAMRETRSSNRRPEHGWLIAGGLFFGADLATWHIAIGMTTVANATLLANLAPLFVAPAAWLLWRERVNRTFLLGLLLALAGTAILMGEGLGLHRERLAGDAISVLAAAFYAGYLLLVSHLRRHDHSAMQILSWSSATVAVVLLPIAWLAGETILPQSLYGWGVLAGLAMLSHVGGQGLITYSMATLPASFSAVGLLIQPLAAAVLAWMLLHERFGAQQAVAGAVILGGILLCRLASRAPAVRPT
jgi:drug/metabolite transporter (DMT)-like permease